MPGSWKITARLRGSMAAALLALTGGCASLDGQAVGVLSVSDVQQVATDHPPATALSRFYALPVAQRRGYRDQVIGSYLAAADIRYLEFRGNLSREMKGTGVALDMAVLGLTAGASLAGEATANALSAAAAAFTGTRASLSSELWFKRTLPAIVTAMDARRTEIRTQIVARMQLSAEAYSLAEAFGDIARYQEAASLDAGISIITAEANQRAVTADARYADVVLTYSGVPPAGVTQRKIDLKARIEAALDTVEEARAAATAVNLTPPDGAPVDDVRAEILAKMTGLNTLADLDRFEADLAAFLKEP